MNSNTTPVLISTMMLFTRADSRTPSESMKVSTIMIRKAGRLNTVSTPGIAPGAPRRASGRTMPTPFSSDWK